MELCCELLKSWAERAEGYWYDMPDEPGLGCYGTGYNSWGVQTNQKYLSAVAVLATLGELKEEERVRWRDRALAALRFSLRSHHSGDYRCTDGTQWGHTWISALGIERMMHGVYLLEPHLDAGDRAALQRMLTSEASWVCDHQVRGEHGGVVADPWARSGQNVPESNLWDGAILWRAAAMYPDHAEAESWKERAHEFLINAVSVATDAEEEAIVAARPVRKRHVGANFFPNYALDHHGYLNVGYMVICLSNAAMLHFDMKRLGLPAPESLHHHQGDLWQVVRRLIFADGRLARIGGDSRVRYAYCQEYLLPSLLYAAERLGEEYADHLLVAQLELIRGEAEFNGDGSFYGRRLAELAGKNPYYYTRLESDRACALGMAIAYGSQLEGELAGVPAAARANGFEDSVAGAWCEPEHGAVLHRCSTRLAAFSWRAFGLAQGMCQPPDDGHLAEWAQNLGGLCRFAGDDGAIRGGQTQHRRLIGYHIDSFPGGFATCGQVMEGVGLSLDEGWRGAESALHQLAFVALPDGHTVIGLQRVTALGHRVYFLEIKGLHLNLPNDLYNGFERRLIVEGGEIALGSPTEEDGVLPLGSDWAHIDGRIGVVGLYGAEELSVDRCRMRRGGRFASLYVDEICFPARVGMESLDPGEVALDVGWAVLSEGSEAQTRDLEYIPIAAGEVRGAEVLGMDGRRYAVLAHCGEEAQEWSVGELSAGVWRQLAVEGSSDIPKSFLLEAGRVVVLVQAE